jgi:hypothetical protein
MTQRRAVKLSDHQFILLEAIGNCIGGFPLNCVKASVRPRVRRLQDRGLIRKHKAIARLSAAGRAALRAGRGREGEK